MFFLSMFSITYFIYFSTFNTLLLAVCTIENNLPVTSAPHFVLQNKKFFLAITNDLTVFSAELLLISKYPFYKKLTEM